MDHWETDEEFLNVWEQLLPKVEKLLKKYLRPSEIEDGLQLARIHVYSALQTWNPSKASLSTYVLMIIKHRLRDIIRLRYPFSVAFGTIEDRHRRNNLEHLCWFSIDNGDDGDNFEIASGEESVEDAVVDSVFKEKLRQDLLEIINSAYFTVRERSVLLQFLETGSAPLSRKPRALIKLRQHLEARGYTADDFF